MRHPSVGDIGDFGKYALLRRLAADDLRLGFIWCMTPPEEKKEKKRKAGKKGKGKAAKAGMFGYLKKPTPQDKKLKKLDDRLYDNLRELVFGDKHNVAGLAESGIFSSGTVFFEDELAYHHFEGPHTTDERRAKRKAWINAALKSTALCDMLYFNPEKGLAPEKTSVTDINAPAYVFLKDLKKFRGRDQSLVLCQKLGAGLPAKEQAKRLRRRLAAGLGLKKQDVWKALYSRGGCRVFFVIPAERHKEQLAGRFKAFKQRLEKCAAKIDGATG
jgi:hypothetical protein